MMREHKLHEHWQDLLHKILKFKRLKKADEMEKESILRNAFIEVDLKKYHDFDNQMIRKKLNWKLTQR